jgi:hypothetical protein
MARRSRSRPCRSLDDRQIGAKGIVAPRNSVSKCFVGIFVEAHHAAISRFEFREQFRQLAVAGRAAHQAHPGSALENFFALLLRDAAQHADNFFLAGIFPNSPRREKTFLRGFFADAAGVVEDQPRGVDRLHLLGNRGRAARRPPSRSRGRSSGSRTSQCRRYYLPRRQPKARRRVQAKRRSSRQGVQTNIEWLRHRLRFHHITLISGGLAARKTRATTQRTQSARRKAERDKTPRRLGFPCFFGVLCVELFWRATFPSAIHRNTMYYTYGAQSSTFALVIV